MPGWFPRCRARGYSQGALADHSSRARRLRAADLDEVVAAALAYSLCQAKAKKPGSLAQDTLDRHRRLSGEDHPATLHAANNLVSCLMNLNDFLAARELAEDTLERSQRTLGPDAGQTLAMAGNLAETLTNLDGHGRACELAADTAARHQHLYGDDNLETMWAVTSLINALEGSGDTEAAHELAKESLTYESRIP